MAFFGNRFPALYALALLATWVFPTVTVLSLTMDPVLTHWMGSQPYIALFIFPVCLIVCVFSVKNKRMPESVLVGSVIGPVIVFTLLASSIMFHTRKTSTTLMGGNCAHSEYAEEFEASWERAKLVHDQCLLANPMARVLVHTCDGYQADKVDLVPWSYLRLLEENLMCSGFCSSERPLWTIREFKPQACARAVAQNLHLVSLVCWQIIVYSLFVLMCFLGWWGIVKTYYKEGLYGDQMTMHIPPSQPNLQGAPGPPQQPYAAYAPALPAQTRPQIPVSSQPLLQSQNTMQQQYDVQPPQYAQYTSPQQVMHMPRP